MISPFLEQKKRYITVCAVFGLIYAVLTGQTFSVTSVTDGILYAAMLYGDGIVLWNFFRYAFPRDGLYTSYFLFIPIILTSCLMVGAEYVMFYLFFTVSLDDFAASIPIRLFITFILLVIIRLFYRICDLETGSRLLETEKISEQPKEYLTRFTVRSGQKIKVIPVEDIFYLQADGDYVAIHTAEGHWLKEQTMKYSEEQLPPDRFVRIHRSYIVNVSRITRIERYGERQLVILCNGMQIKISTAGYRILRQRLGL